ncbi:conserved hypothetical protein [Neospora caninum Liverpool]|uniref:Transmembrane protein n=1 Tax=Neospora caninum (strain Liverpool) TaxID=572307 RepID=F0VIP6_NEOCL|nr:conserved hypothetical protein [Neospora caninum Liverpool]CBZ53607.1 conserved hypothetical protein [Neospora caninum Liverpool]CEL67597.1 TPA: hypothetical protein BN1204_033940 [Neospora caninum Liverpool]|eukprot:XP_003883639.1 conserved hypothetical protein [Neospora caninum Liverpool]
MDEPEDAPGGIETPLFPRNDGSRPPLIGQTQETGHGNTFDASVVDNASAGDSSEGGGPLEQHIWTVIVLALVAALLCFLGKRAVAFVDRRIEERKAEDQRRCRSARMRYVEKLEGAMKDFKKTEEFKELEKEAQDREKGVQPEHRRTWRFPGNSPLNPHFAPTYRPNVNDRYQIRRDRGG